MLQRGAVQKLHGDEGFAALIVNLVNGANVRVIQRGGGLGFTLETAKRLWIFGYVVRQELQRHKAAELDIFSLVNHAHAATTELFYDAVVGDGLANEGRGTGHAADILGCGWRQVNEDSSLPAARRLHPRSRLPFARSFRAGRMTSLRWG